MNDNSKNRGFERYNKQNPWISSLRIFMCFVVIRDHFCPVGNTLIQCFIAQFGSIAVPCFMFLSFYYLSKDILENRYERLKERLLRLYVPIVVWNIVYWSIKNITAIILGHNYTFGINALIEGFLFSHHAELTDHLWFLFVQMVIIIVICIVLSYSHTKMGKTVLLLGVAIIAFFLEYSGTNYGLFSGSSYSVSYPLGRIAECIPYAVCGILVSWYLKDINLKYLTLILLLVLTGFAKKIIPEPYGFGYGGGYLFFASSAICISLFTVPDIIKGKGRFLLNYIGSCTMGIYCLHKLVGWGIGNLADRFYLLDIITKRETLVFDVYIFAICLVITITIRIINGKLKWRWVEYIV